MGVLRPAKVEEHVAGSGNLGVEQTGASSGDVEFWKRRGRLLDDNRELLIPETQELVHPHPSFMLFATQVRAVCASRSALRGAGLGCTVWRLGSGCRVCSLCLRAGLRVCVFHLILVASKVQ